MSTLGQLYDRIENDYLNRTDLSAEVKRAVAAAVRFHERRRFWFNEAQTAVTASAGVNFTALPSNLLVIDEVRDYSQPWKLKQKDSETVFDLRIGSATGDPTIFAIYENNFQWWPTPTSANVLTVTYIKQLPVLSATTATASSNAWTSAAEDLIVYHATKIIWANTLRNRDEAMVYAELEKNSLAELQSINEQRLMHGIKATRF